VQAAAAEVPWSLRLPVMAIVPVVGAPAAFIGDRAGIAVFWPALAALVVSVGGVGWWPPAVSLVFPVACFVLTVAFTTPMVVLIGSAGLAGSTVGLALDRVVLVGGGALVAVGLARAAARPGRRRA